MKVHFPEQTKVGGRNKISIFLDHYILGLCKAFLQASHFACLMNNFFCACDKEILFKKKHNYELIKAR